jgi:hypothetical protein
MGHGWRRFLREPLVHFLLAGGALYLLFAVWGARHHETDAARQIVVDRPTLLRFMQYRAKAFEPETFAARFDALAPAQRRQLIDDYVREEALYREAQALGLARGDDVMRQRLVQKMEFLLEAPAAAGPTEAVLRAWFDAHRDQYVIPPSWTFTHVFLDPAVRGQAPAAREASRLLVALNRERVGFNEAPQYGDRFAYLQNYVERTADYIESHFGPEFLATLKTLPVAAHGWTGPVRSSHGLHLLLITAHSDARVPALDELRAQVSDDFRREQAAAARDRATRALIDSYAVKQMDLASPKP